MSLVPGESSLLDGGSELVLGLANKSSIMERCKVLASLASLSFLFLVGFEKQIIVGIASGFSIGLFGPKLSTTQNAKSCSVK